MAARARGRPSQLKDDADEERNLWKSIREDAKDLDAKLLDSNSKLLRMQELERIINEYEGRGDRYPVEAGAELMDLLRESIKLTEDISSQLDDPDGNGLLQNMDILAALRGAGQVAPSTSRASSTVKPARPTKRSKLDMPNDTDRDSVIADSPGGPSPKLAVPGGATARLKAGTASRSGSVPAARESFVKMEEPDIEPLRTAATPTPSTSTTVSAAGPSGGIATNDRVKLVVGAEVFYKNVPRPTPRGKPSAASLPIEEPEGEGILCRVTKISGEGKQRRYQIRDIDDESGPVPPEPYQASVSALRAIRSAEENETLPVLSPGTQVLALYPNTTTFYKAEVSSAGKDGKRGIVRLRFEGEDEASVEQEVERRYVLPP